MTSRGSIVLEDRNNRRSSLVLGQIGVKKIVLAIKAFTSNHSTGRAVNVHEISWTKPQWGATGAVIRNYRGEAVAGATEKIFNAFGLASAETWVLEKGLALVDQL